jgi:hypothetical protein
MGIADALPFLKEGKKAIESIFPTIVQEVDAVVYGDPIASRKELYNVALAAALGHIVPYAPGLNILPVGLISLQYHSELNVVRVYIKQVVKLAYGLANFVNPGSALSALKYFKSLQIFTGPKEELRGGKWAWFAGIPLGIVGDALNNVKYTDRMILTKNPTYTTLPAGGVTRVSHNPKPRQDNISRASLPIASQSTVIDAIEPGANPYNRPDYLLFQALHAPCDAQKGQYTPTFPTGTATPPDTTHTIVNNPTQYTVEPPQAPPPRESHLTSTNNQ